MQTNSFIKIWLPLTLLESFDENKKPLVYHLAEVPNTICIHVSLENYKKWQQSNSQKILLKG